MSPRVSTNSIGSPPVATAGTAHGQPAWLRTAAHALVACLLMAALLLPMAPRALAHGGEEHDNDYLSRVTKVTPDGSPVKASVYEGDDTLRVTNTGDEELVIYGYENDPYVRIGPEGVFVNTNTTAYYSNSDRYGTTPAPAGTGNGEPKWERDEQYGRDTYEFHDHRIHWMLRQPPASIDESDPKRQKVNDWKVPFSYGSQKGEIHGELFYVGGHAEGMSRTMLVTWITVGAFLLGSVIGGAAWMRGRRSPAAAGDAASADDDVAGGGGEGGDGGDASSPPDGRRDDS